MYIYIIYIEREREYMRLGFLIHINLPQFSVKLRLLELDPCGKNSHVVLSVKTREEYCTL